MTAAGSLVLALLLPLAGAGLVAAFRTRPNLREAASLLTAAALFAVVASLLPGVLAGARPAIVLAQTLPGIALELQAEPLGLVFALVASFLWLVTTLYSIGYMRAHHEENQTRFYIYFAVALASTIGVAFAGNMFTLFAFYEVLTLSTFPLVTHAGTDEARRAGRVYLGILLATSIGLQLIAIVGTWMFAGTLEFTPGGVLAGHAPPAVSGLLFALYVFGIGKAAVMPFHRWLPSAMVAPTPVSALLHAVAVVKAGVFAILKVSVYIFGLDLLGTLGTDRWLSYVAAATILLASLVALQKDNLKARLAYSTVSQLSYIVLGATLANPLGILGGGLHILMHAFGKITLFFCAGAILVASHKTEISQMRGLGRRMPFTMFAFLIGSLSVIGLPPLGGFWSKWYLALGTLQDGHLLLLAVLMVSSLLNVAYLLPIPVRAFFSASDEEPTTGGLQEAPLPCLLALGITSLGCVALFFAPGPFYRLMQMAVGVG